MASGWKSWGLRLAAGTVICFAIASSGDRALGQITPDGTLGAESSVVTPTNNNGIPTDQIDGGVTRGANLFHSFNKFSVPTGGAVYFNNALNIQNIISRVTGKSISNIDGLISARGTANLFLLNPNGIIFGSNARLNIGGSFLASTASAVNFADGIQFSATAHSTTPLLTVSVPIGLQFGGDAGSIRNQSQATNSNGESVGLEVQQGETLALVGGDVKLEGGVLQALGGRVELGGLASSGSIELSMNGSLGSLSFPDGMARADVYLSDTAKVNVASNNAGSIAITARNIDIVGQSVLDGGLGRNSGFLGATAGDITLDATGAIAVAKSFIRNTVRAGAVGDSGDINIKAGSLSVTDGGRLIASTFGTGNAGNVNINARDTVSFDGVGSSQTPDSSSGAFSRVDDGTGDGGNITIKAGSLSVTNGARLAVITDGAGNAGSVTIDVRDTVFFDGVGSNNALSGAFSRVDRDGNGDGGDIKVIASSLSATNGARLAASTQGQGDAGNVTIHVENTVSFDGVGSNNRPSGAFSSVDLVNDGANKKFPGQGGNVTITTEQLIVRNSAQVNVSSERSGNAGELVVKAGSIFLNSGGELQASTVSSSGGNINLQVQDLILMHHQSLISALAGGTGNGGNVTINAPLIVAVPTEDSDIIANAFEGNGGNINITTSGIFGLEYRDRRTTGSDITASSEFGVDGYVEINTPEVDPSQGILNLPAQPVDSSQQIATSCGAGRENEFIITGRGGLPPDPTKPLDSNAIWTDWATLPLRAGEHRSRGAGEQRGRSGEEKITYDFPPASRQLLQRGEPPQRTGSPASRQLLQRGEPPQRTGSPAPSASPAQIVEAQGWVINDKGEVVLTANAPNATPHNPWMTPANCHTLQNSL